MKIASVDWNWRREEETICISKQHESPEKSILSIPHHWHSFVFFSFGFSRYFFFSLLISVFLDYFSVVNFIFRLLIWFTNDTNTKLQTRWGLCDSIFKTDDKQYFFFCCRPSLSQSSSLFLFMLVFLFRYFCFVRHFSRRLSCGFVVTFSLVAPPYLFWWFSKWVYVSVIIIVIIITFRVFSCVLKLYRKVEEHVCEEPSPRQPMIRCNMSKRYLPEHSF